MLAASAELLAKLAAAAPVVGHGHHGVWVNAPAWVTSSTVTCQPWNGTNGGVLAFRDGGPWLHSVRHNGTRERLIISTDFRIAMLGTAFARASIDMRSIAPYVTDVGATMQQLESGSWRSGMR